MGTGGKKTTQWGPVGCLRQRIVEGAAMGFGLVFSDLGEESRKHGFPLMLSENSMIKCINLCLGGRGNGVEFK